MCCASAIYLDFILHIVLMSFFFSFLSFVVPFFLLCLLKGFTYLVSEVLKDTLVATNTPPTPPNQLLDLIVYGSSFVGLPTLIVTTNFGDDFLWANDGSESYVQYVDYVHEFPTKSPSDSPKLNPKTNVDTFVHFLNPFIL